MPSIVLECEYNAELAFTDIGAGVFGKRVWAQVTGGELRGDRLKGELTPMGGDWLIMDPTGIGQIDVRIQFRTHDGVFINVYYDGVIEWTPAIQALVAGSTKATDYGDQYFFTHVRLETGDARYAWVNNTMFIGQGRVIPGPKVEYRLFRLQN